MKESIKSIFNWNHISDELTEEQVEELILLPLIS